MKAAQIKRPYRNFPRNFGPISICPIKTSHGQTRAFIGGSRLKSAALFCPNQDIWDCVDRTGQDKKQQLLPPKTHKPPCHDTIRIQKYSFIPYLYTFPYISSCSNGGRELRQCVFFPNRNGIFFVLLRSCSCCDNVFDCGCRGLLLAR